MVASIRLGAIAMEYVITLTEMLVRFIITCITGREPLS